MVYRKIKEKTWDSMDVHLSAINGLNSNIIVFNYNIFKKTTEEIRRIKAIYNLRKIEILEKF